MINSAVFVALFIIAPLVVGFSRIREWGADDRRRVATRQGRVLARPVHLFACPTSPVARRVAQSPRFHLRGESQCESSKEGCRRTSRRGGCLRGTGIGSPFVCRRPGSTTVRGFVRSFRRDDQIAQRNWSSRSRRPPIG